MDTYSTSTLIKVVEDVRQPDPFLLNKLFPNVMVFDTEEIAFDILNRGKPIAPFVSPLVKGKVMRQQGFSTNIFKPAYLKPKQVLRPHVALKRKAGERFAGVMSPMERKNAWIAMNFQEQSWMITRRKEWMAAKVMIDGAVTVDGDDYPTQVVDFMRDATLTQINAGATLWSAGTSTPLQDLESWSNRMHKAKGGSFANIVIMEPDTWGNFVRHQDVLDALNADSRGTATMQLNTTISETFEAATFRGTVNGQMEIWVYGDTYENSLGVDQPFLPSGTVLMANTNTIEGVQAHGAILDHDADLQPVEMFPKMWVEQDPSVIFTMTQSAPLIVPPRPNATFRASVL